MTEATAGTQFPCPACGAPEMAFDAGSQMLRCPFCGHTHQVPQQQTAAPQEHDLQQGMQQGAAQPAPQQQQDQAGYGTSTRTLQCQTCGARVAFAGREISKDCDFCGSQHVLEQQSTSNLIRPESLVAFGVSQEQANEKFRSWLGGSFFRPGDLKSKARTDGIAGMYVPYWTFDAQVSSQWRAEAGYYYYETETYVETVNGQQQKKTRQVRKTRWEPASGHRQDAHDDVLVCASRGLPEKLANRFATFDTRQLRPYDPQYLAGWRAEEYGIGLDEAWPNAQQRIEQEQHNRCSNDVPGDTQRGLQVQNQFGQRTYKHVLLPLWISSYRYNDKTYRFLVNGQTGEVSGEAPISWIRVAFVVLLVVLAIGGCLAGATMLSSGGG